MLLLLLLAFKPTGTSTKPSPAKKDQIANFNTLPTFAPLFFTTGPSLEQLHTKNRFFVPITGLQIHKKKNTRRPKDNVFPTFLLTTMPPGQHHTSLTYRGVSRPLVELLRTQLKKTPSISSSPSPLGAAKANMSSCSFLSGSLSPLVGFCTARGMCRVGRTDYKDPSCKKLTSSLGDNCSVNAPLKRTWGTCSTEGHCVGRYITLNNHILKPLLPLLPTRDKEKYFNFKKNHVLKPF